MSPMCDVFQDFIIKQSPDRTLEKDLRLLPAVALGLTVDYQAISTMQTWFVINTEQLDLYL